MAERQQQGSMLEQQQQGYACWPLPLLLGNSAVCTCSCRCAAGQSSWWCASRTAMLLLVAACVTCWAARARRYFEGSQIKHRWLRKALQQQQLPAPGVVRCGACSRPCAVCLARCLLVGFRCVTVQIGAQCSSEQIVVSRRVWVQDSCYQELARQL